MDVSVTWTNRGYDCRGNNRCNDHTGGCPSPQGRFVQPDKRHCLYLPGVQCEACKRISHEAAYFDMLAVALFVGRYTKADLLAADRSAIKQKWLSCWKEELGRPAWTPRQVMRTYCKTQNISEGNVDSAMDWEGWPADLDNPDLE